MTCVDGLLERIHKIQVIDTHTHIGLEGVQPPRKEGELVRQVLLSNYVSGALASAGVDLDDPAYRDLPTDALMVALAPHMEAIRLNGTYQTALTAWKEWYGFHGDGSDPVAVAALVKKIESAYAQGEAHRWPEVFERAHVEVALKNVQLPYFEDYLPALPSEARQIEQRLFRTVPRVDSFLFGLFRLRGSPMLELTMPDMISAYEATTRVLGLEPATLSQCLDLIDAAFEHYHRHGAVAVKMTSAYLRDLRFDESTESEAQAAFDRRHHVATVADVKPFQDYLFLQILDRCAKYGLPIQIHTGLQAGCDANLPDCNPVHLTPILQNRRFKKVRFALLHGGYPYTSEMTVLAKSFPNVYLDFSWVPLLSPSVCRRCLNEWLDLVPVSKLMHGSDVQTVEHLHAITLRVRDLLADVLSDRIRSREISESQGLEIARRILRTNATDLYQLSLG